MMAEDKDLMMNIVVDDGSRRVPILNKSGEEIGAFTFHPTDLGIIERYNDMASGFDAIVEPLQALEATEGADVDLTNPTYIDALGEASRRLYEAVNVLLGSDDAAEAFFGKLNPFSPVDGDFYCTQVLNALGQYIGRVFETETAKFSAKAAKYAKKAKK